LFAAKGIIIFKEIGIHSFLNKFKDLNCYFLDVLNSYLFSYKFIMMKREWQAAFFPQFIQNILRNNKNFLQLKDRMTREFH